MRPTVLCFGCRRYSDGTAQDTQAKLSLDGASARMGWTMTSEPAHYQQVKGAELIWDRRLKAGARRMLRGVRKVRIGVRDQERARRFWVETMGCEVAQDATYGDERWLEVRLPDGVLLILEHTGRPADPNPSGQPNTPLFLACDDVDATWRDLAARGVAFPQEPIDMPFGRWALLADTEGNRFPLLAAGH